MVISGRESANFGRLYRHIVVIGLLTVSCTAISQSLDVSASYYADSREYSTLHATLSLKGLPGGFSVWGFTDFHSDQDDKYSTDLSRAFSEYRLSHSGLGRLLSIEGLGTQVEHNHISPGNVDVTRIGLTYKHAIFDGSWLQWRVFPIETEDDRQQLSLIYALKLSPNFSVSGFVDYNIVEGGENRWVLEPELSYKVSQRLHLLLEYRFNEFEQANSALDGRGIALGFRLDF